MKNIGIGIDIENIFRFEKLDIKANTRFFDKIFTVKEKKYCLSKKNPFPHFAARFSGKEAVIKAISSLSQAIISYKEIEIINDKKGVPIVSLNKKKFNKFRVKLTLSHCEDKVVAFAIITNSDNYEKN